MVREKEAMFMLFGDGNEERGRFMKAEVSLKKSFQD